MYFSLDAPRLKTILAWGIVPEGWESPCLQKSKSRIKKKVEERRKMEKSTNFEMFVEAKHYIDKHHADNPIDFVINGYIFYYMSGRFPNALMHDVCDVVEALRTHYIHEFCVIDKDLSDDDEELPFK